MKTKIKRLILLCSFHLSATMLIGAEFPEGVIFYRSAKGESDDLARVAEFKSLENFQNVINFVEADSNSKSRVHRNLQIEIIRYPNLFTGTISSEKEIEAFDEAFAKIKQAIQRYRMARQVIHDNLARFEAAQQMLRQGKVLVAGTWKEKSEINMSTSLTGPVFLPELTVADTTYRMVGLSSIEDEEIVVTHSGGVARLKLADLEPEDVAKLNRTSEKFRIGETEEESGTPPVEVPGEMANQSKNSSEPSEPSERVPPASFDSIIDLKGKIYKEVSVKGVDPDGIRIFHSGGATKLSFSDLSESLQKQFGYDKEEAMAFAEADQQNRDALAQRMRAEARKQRKLEELMNSSLTIRFRITQILDFGLIIWNLDTQKTEFLKIDSDSFDVADGEVYKQRVIPQGTFEYESILGVQKRVRAWEIFPEE